MANIRPEKQAAVAGLKEQLSSAKGAVLTGYRGLTVAQDMKLRAKLREAGVTYHVVKNTMVRIAANEIGLEGLDPVLNGTTALAVSADDAVAPAKVIYEFIKENKLENTEVLTIKAGLVEGKVINVEKLKLWHPYHPAKFSSRKFLAVCKLLSLALSTYFRVLFAMQYMCLMQSALRKNLHKQTLSI